MARTINIFTTVTYSGVHNTRRLCLDFYQDVTILQSKCSITTVNIYQFLLETVKMQILNVFKRDVLSPQLCLLVSWVAC